MTHAKKHGGYAAQAKRRGEEWIACTDCSTHSRRAQAVPDEPETWGEFWRALGVLILILAAGYALTLLAAAYALL